ncbi:imidazole glycerol phosphate synthase subunit HisH [Bacillus timonensis]|nr:imidazole glycerol phosphate synthase subunit HisH [Bacillus timonensis]
MIGIIDYGMGNLYSVSKALERMGVSYLISESPQELEQTTGLLLPGVGSFKDAMDRLNDSGLTSFIKSSVENGKPLLGICLGMQLLFEESVENGYSKGLGLLEGDVVRIPGITESGTSYKVPHMGWNELTLNNPSPLLQGIDGGYVYFVHSYYVRTVPEVVLASSQYDVLVPAVVGKNKVFGTQFHPEKSSEVGVSILKNFISIVEELA